MEGSSPAKRVRAFTLVEVLIATAILLVILAISFSVMNGMMGLWRQSSAKIDAFQDARAVFDIVTRRLGQATLNTYWDYYDASHQPFRLSGTNPPFTPAYYGRYSDLQFVCGDATTVAGGTLPPNYSTVATHAVFFTASTGLTANTSYQLMPELLTACGYFAAFGNDNASRPNVPNFNAPAKYRWRLMELSAPTESLQVFNSPTGTAWFTTPIANGQVRPVADNVIALVVWPRLSPTIDASGTSIAPNYSYDSRTTTAWSGSTQPAQACQLPPTVQVTMVSIDEPSALHIDSGSQPPVAITNALSGLFSTSGSVTNYGSDLQTLEQRLTAQHINYRVFSTTIAMPNSHWSQ